MPAHRAPTRRLGPAVRRAGVVLLSVAALSSCQLPDVSMSPSLDAGSSSAAARTTSASPSATPTSSSAPAEEAVQAVVTPEPAAPVRAPGELDVGSVTHVLAAGERQLVIDWWTTEQAAAWTASGSKTLQLSAHLEGGDPDDELLVLVTRFTAVLDDGTTRTQVDEDSGEFVIQAPYTYGTVLTLPPSAGEATALTVDVQFDLLIETEPGSERYFRQTVLDSLVLPLALPATPAATAPVAAQENP